MVPGWRVECSHPAKQLPTRPLRLELENQLRNIRVLPEDKSSEAHRLGGPAGGCEATGL